MSRPMRRATRELMADHQADLVVTFHPTYSYPLTWLKIPCAFVFTDLITNHALWCAPGAERYVVPTELARTGAISHGVPSDRVSVTGLPEVSLSESAVHNVSVVGSAGALSVSPVKKPISAK